MRGESGQPEATILHISDTLFGTYHRFNGEEQSLADHLLVDLRKLLIDKVPAIDLIVLSGDIVEHGLKSEYEQAKAFVDALCTQTGLKYHRVVVVPGNHDVNWSLSESYFAECRAEEVEPRLPYAKKWRHYQQFVSSLHGPAAFTEEQPYRIHRFDDLRVVVAALNSTVQESHRADDHYGWCGSEQLRWAEARLRDAAGCVRVGVLHHNARRRPVADKLVADKLVADKLVADNENLRDADALTTILGPRLDLLLHGHTHDGAPDRLANGTLVLATGAAAVTAQWRPGEVPNQYQILRLRPDRVTRWARQWDASKQRWVADSRINLDRDERVDIPIAPAGWQQSKSPERSPRDRHEERLDRAGDFLSQVEFVTRRDVGEDCPIERRHKGSPELSYLIVVRPAAPLRCVGVVDGPLSPETLDRFDEAIFEPLRERGGAELVLVHHGPQVPELRQRAQHRGVRVKTWTEYNDLLDASAYRTWLRGELDRDQQLYPQALYLPQRFRDIDRWGTAGRQPREDLVAHVYDSILEEEGQFFLVLGEAGFGKSFLVRRLAYLMLANPRAGITPVVIYLRDRDKRQTIEEMVSNVLIHSRSLFNADRFQHSLQAGIIALLIDGYDEFAVRVGYHNAAAQLSTFIQALQGRAKILLTTRPNHFRSTDEVTTALFDSLRSVHHGTVFELEPFSQEQQTAFLTRWFEVAGDSTPEAAAQATRWMSALARVDNLPELACTPRMLSFMVADLSVEKIEAAAGKGTVTAANLYQRLVDLWLAGEADKVNPLDERNVTAEQRQRLLEEIAFRLWRIGERDITEDTLQAVARDSLDLPRIELTVDQAAQLIGGRTLLQVDAHRWRFAHQSVWEFLLANNLARRLRAGEQLEKFGEAQLTQLTIRFLMDLAPAEATTWAARIAGGAQ